MVENPVGQELQMIVELIPRLIYVINSKGSSRLMRPWSLYVVVSRSKLKRDLNQHLKGKCPLAQVLSGSLFPEGGKQILGGHCTTYSASNEPAHNMSKTHLPEMRHKRRSIKRRQNSVLTPQSGPEHLFPLGAFRHYGCFPTRWGGIPYLELPDKSEITSALDKSIHVVAPTAVWCDSSTEHNDIPIPPATQRARGQLSAGPSTREYRYV